MRTENSIHSNEDPETPFKPNGAMTGPHRLLLLEDDPNDIALLKKRLAQDWPACELVSTMNEEGFRGALSAGNFDLIISDYVLPGFHGLEALALARERCP